VDDFDELLFSYIASSGGGNRDAVGLTWDEFTDGFETFLDKGTDQYYINIIFSVYKLCTCKPLSNLSTGLISATFLSPVYVPTEKRLLDICAAEHGEGHDMQCFMEKF